VADPRIKDLAYGAILESLGAAIRPMTNANQMNLAPQPPQVNFPYALDVIAASPAPTQDSQVSSALPKNEEQQFQNWIRSTDWFKEYVKEFNEEPDLNIQEYDYRAAWKAGITPQRDPYDKNRYHWPSSDPSGKMLKSQDHPTAWKEFFMRDTGMNPDALGLKTKEEADVYLKGLK